MKGSGAFASSTGEGGKIKRKLHAFLEGAAAYMEWRPGEDLEGNPGVTIIFPHKALPAMESQLAADIVTFCSIPRTESRIAAEFLKHSPRDVKEAIRALLRKGHLKTVLKGGRETYVA